MKRVKILLTVSERQAADRLRDLVQAFSILEPSVEAAASPAAAMTALSRGGIDLLLMDLNGDGRTIDSLCRTAAGIPCIVLIPEDGGQANSRARAHPGLRILSEDDLTSSALEAHVCEALLDQASENGKSMMWRALRTAVNAIADACCLLEAETSSIVYWNAKFGRLMGIEGSDAPLPIRDLGTDDRFGEAGDIVARACLAALHSGSSISTYAGLCDGTKLRVNADVLPGGSQTHTGALCRFDILERPEDALGRRTDGDRLFRLMAEAAPNIVWLMSAEGKCLYVNKRWEEVTGQLQQDALGLGWMEHVHPEDLRACRNAIEQAVAGRTPCVAEWRLRRADGEVRWLLCTGNPRYRDDGSFAGFVGSCKDVTESRRARALVQEADNLAATGRMAVRIAHEINNPLGGIRNSFLLIKDAIPPDHKYHPYVARIERELDRMANVVRQMYDLYKPAEGPAGECNVASAMDDVCELVRARALESQVEVKSENTAEDLILSGTDEGMLRQVLFNVVMNAIEASPPGATVQLSVRSVDGSLDIEVADEGPGISAELAGHIFEPFFTTKDRQVQGTTGLGLGLATSKALVETMGGTISFTNRPTGGTVACIRLPGRKHSEVETS